MSADNTPSRPRLIGLLGRAGSGKDTVGRILGEILGDTNVRIFALADPIKDFAGKVFGFTEDQLRGPTSARNAVDHRFTFHDLPPGGIRGWLRSLIQGRSFRSRSEVLALNQCASVNRGLVWAAFSRENGAFLSSVLPAGASRARAELTLRGVMAQIMRNTQITPRLTLQLIGTEFGREVNDLIWAYRAIKTANEAMDSGMVAVITDVRFPNEVAVLRDVGGQVWRIERDTDVVATEKAGVAGHASEKAIDEAAALATHTVDNSGTLADLRTVVNAMVRDD